MLQVIQSYNNFVKSNLFILSYNSILQEMKNHSIYDTYILGYILISVYKKGYCADIQAGIKEVCYNSV
jgi:hypothetical protein